MRARPNAGRRFGIENDARGGNRVPVALGDTPSRLTGVQNTLQPEPPMTAHLALPHAQPADVGLSPERTQRLHEIDAILPDLEALWLQTQGEIDGLKKS